MSRLEEIEKQLSSLAAEVAALKSSETKPSVRLFVGAKCRQRSGGEITISKIDRECTFNGVRYPYTAYGAFNIRLSFMEDGRYLPSPSADDIVEVLNPEDHPDNRPTKEYRPVNQTDLGKKVVSAHEGYRDFCIGRLLGFGVSDTGKPVAFISQAGEIVEYEPHTVAVEKRPDDKEVTTIWVNVYKGGSIGTECKSIAVADSVAGGSNSGRRIARVRIQYYPGQMDE